MTDVGVTQNKRDIPGRGGLIGAQGYRRAQELAAQDEIARQAELSRLLDDLGRKPTARERLLLDELAGLAVRARRHRAKGRVTATAAVVHLMTRVVAKLDRLPPPPPPAPDPGPPPGSIPLSGRQILDAMKAREK